MTSTTIQYFCENPNHNMGEYYDATRFYDVKTLKKKYGFHTRSPIAVLIKRFDDDIDYVNAPQNKDNKQKVPTCCPEGCEGAEPMDMSMFANGNEVSQIYQSWYPYGDVIIKGETHEQYETKQQRKKEIERCKIVRKELITKLKGLNEVKLCMLIDKIEDMLEGIGES
jgi:hypothetical protein